VPCLDSRAECISDNSNEENWLRKALGLRTLRTILSALILIRSNMWPNEDAHYSIIYKNTAPSSVLTGILIQL